VAAATHLRNLLALWHADEPLGAIHGLHARSVGVPAVARHASEAFRLVDVAIEGLGGRHQTLVPRLQVTRDTPVLRRLRSRCSGPCGEGEQEGGSQSKDGHPKTKGSSVADPVIREA
jgi:hypothetical protein